MTLKEELDATFQVRPDWWKEMRSYHSRVDPLTDGCRRGIIQRGGSYANVLVSSFSSTFTLGRIASDSDIEGREWNIC